MKIFKAFTLVELLVVIAIISMLAGLLLPVLEDALASARTMACLSNLKQVELSNQTYTEDHDGWMYINDSYGHYRNVLPRQYFTWQLMELQYIPDKNPVIYCPLKIANSMYIYPYMYGVRGEPYSYYKTGSATILRRDPGAVLPSGIHELLDPVSETLGHSQFILIGDACHLSGWGAMSIFRPTASQPFNLRHGEAGTAAFADGHGACLGEAALAEYGITNTYVGTDGFPNFDTYRYP